MNADKLIEAYQERIAHLRTGLEMARDDLDWHRQLMGVPPTKAIDTLLDQDIKRDVEADQYR